MIDWKQATSFTSLYVGPKDQNWETTFDILCFNLRNNSSDISSYMGEKMGKMKKNDKDFLQLRLTTEF